MRRKAFLAAGNILIILAMVGYVLFFSFSQRERSVQTEKRSFLSTVEVMEKVSSNYLLSCQRICNDWAKSINAGQYTMDEAMVCLQNMNADDGLSIQLLRADTLAGLSSLPKTLDPGDYSVAYTRTYGTLYEQLLSFAAAETDGDGIHVTRNFSNPVNGDFVVAFCGRVTLYDETGTPYGALVLLLDRLERMKASWVFPVGYADAQIAIIDEDGNYIIRADSMKSENFYEFIRAYNDLTYPQSDALRGEVNGESVGSLEYRNAGGRETLYAYTHLGSGGNWLLIGAIPISSLNTARLQWSLLAATCLAFLLLIVLDGTYFIALSKRLAASLKEAESANRAKTNFLSSMSHDIRTPMNAIVGMTAIAEKSLDDREQVKDCLGKIDLASNHLLTLINDILDISRVESGNVRLNPSAFSLAEAMRNVVNILYPQAREKGLSFDVHLNGIVRERIVADELRLNQIWINILSNAVKYTNAGGRVVVALREEVVPGDEQNVRLIYQVSDTGIGMTEEFLRTIYAPFTRAADSRTDGIQGSGLGMAITKQIVDLMKGTIDVKSELDKGTVFTVTLTLPAAADELESARFPGLRVLVEDGDPAVLLDAAAALRALGAEADTAADGRQAAELVRTGRAEARDYDVVLLDASPSDGDGAAAAAAIRGAAGGPRPAVLLSSYDSPDLSDGERAAGADGRILKPYFRSVLVKRLNSALYPPDEPEERKPERQFSGLSVLVAEDNDLNWEILDRMLSFYGIVARRAENGRSCLEILRNAARRQYRMIFMDIQMPVMNGYDAARAIRSLSDGEKAAIPIIAMTADAFAEDVENCKKAGMNGHIAKPINMEKVLAAIEKYARQEE